jgi:hypothetical protein
MKVLVLALVYEMMQQERLNIRLCSLQNNMNTIWQSMLSSRGAQYQRLLTWIGCPESSSQQEWVQPSCSS